MIGRLVISGRLPSLNEYIDACRKHAQVGRRMKRDCQDMIMWELKAQTRGMKFDKPVVIRTDWYELNARRDPDNVCGYGHKIILDALVDLGVLIDDGRKYVAGFTDRFFTDKDDPRIEITIEEQAQ